MAKRSRRSEGKIVAIGFDGNSVLQGFVKDGTIQAICVQSSYDMGYISVKSLFLNPAKTREEVYYVT